MLPNNIDPHGEKVDALSSACPCSCWHQGESLFGAYMSLTALLAYDVPISQRAAPSLKPSAGHSSWLELNNIALLSNFIVTLYVWHSFSFMIDINFS